MKRWALIAAMVLGIGLTGCSNLSEKDLADLQNPNDTVKKHAIEKVSSEGRMPLSLVNRLSFDGIMEKRAVDIMVEQLKRGKESEDIQLSILSALGNLGRRVTVPVAVLVERLDDKNPEIRLQAVESLGKIGNKEAVPALVDLLEKEPNKYPIIWALGEIGDRSAVPALNKLLSSEDKYLKYNANKALGKIR
jgi:HEAT repeat protein